MWTEEKIEKAAEEYEEKVYDDDMYCNDELDYTDIYHAFLAGAKFIINNTQKENEPVS